MVWIAKKITQGEIMKNIKVLLLSVAFLMTITFVCSQAVNAQDSMMKQVGDKTVKVTKKVYHGGRKVGTTVGHKTWNGSKWVASKSWKGGKWVAVKTVHGTKWVWRKAKRPFVKPKRNM